MKVSVIMLTYNREALVGRAIESILCQTLTDFEYIIVDNGSSDRSGEIAEEYAKKDSRIKVVHIPKSNIGTGRNTGLDLASGEYITFIDDDDTAEPDMLEFLYNLAKENGADISICGTNFKHFKEKFILDASNALIKLFERIYFNVGFPTKLIHRKLFEENRFLKKGIFDDIYLMPKLIAAAKIVVYEGVPLYIITRHNGNNSAWTTNHQLITSEILTEYLQIYHERTLWLEKEFSEHVADWHYFEWSFMISMIHKISEFNIKECEEQYIYMLSELKKNKKSFLMSTRILDFEKEWIKKYV